MIYDSEERIMMLEHFRYTAQGSWVILLDATTLARRTGKDESYWPIGVTKSTLMCIILKVSKPPAWPSFPTHIETRAEKSILGSLVPWLKRLRCQCLTWTWTLPNRKKKRGK